MSVFFFYHLLPGAFTIYFVDSFQALFTFWAHISEPQKLIVIYRADNVYAAFKKLQNIQSWVYLNVWHSSYFFSFFIFLYFQF